MNKKGFSTVELLVSFIIITFISIAMFNTVLKLLDRISDYQAKVQLVILNGNIINTIQKDLNQKKFYGANTCGENCYEIVYQDLSTARLKIGAQNNTIQYGGITEKLPSHVLVTGNVSLTTQTYANDIDKNNTILKINIPIEHEETSVANDINVVYQFDSRDTGGLPDFGS